MEVEIFLNDVQRDRTQRAEKLAGECCSLPIFPTIEEWEIAETAAAVRSFEVPATD